VLVKLAVVRIEYADGVASDTTIFDDCVMDARRWKQRREGRGGKGSKSSGGGGVGVTALGEEGGGGRWEGVSGVGGGSDARLGSEEWWPSEEELNPVEGGSSSEPDPDIPIVRNVSLNVDLDLSLLNVSPTIVMTASDAEEGGAGVGDIAAAASSRGRATSRASAPREDEMLAVSPGSQVGGRPAGGHGSPRLAPTSAPPSTPSSPGLSATSPAQKVGSDGEASLLSNLTTSSTEISVRFFLRITVYTDFNSTEKVWDAQEIFLYRGDFYGRFVGEWKKSVARGARHGERPTLSLDISGLVVEGTPANSPPNSRAL